MQKHMRWSAILVVLLLALAACSPEGGGDETEEPDGSAARPPTGGGGSAADCDADEFGCYEVAEGEPIVIGTALVITGANETLGLDSQYGAEVARTLRPEIAGHDGRIQPPGRRLRGRGRHRGRNGAGLRGRRGRDRHELLECRQYRPPRSRLPRAS